MMKTMEEFISVAQPLSPLTYSSKQSSLYKAEDQKESIKPKETHIAVQKLKKPNQPSLHWSYKT